MKDILVVGSDLDTKFAHPNNGTGLFALLSASLGLALIRGHDGYPRQLVRLLLLLLLLRGHVGQTLSIAEKITPEKKNEKNAFYNKMGFFFFRQ